MYIHRTPERKSSSRVGVRALPAAAVICIGSARCRVLYTARAAVSWEKPETRENFRIVSSRARVREQASRRFYLPVALLFHFSSLPPFLSPPRVCIYTHTHIRTRLYRNHVARASRPLCSSSLEAGVIPASCRS